jgi:hypothetical protein
MMTAPQPQSGQKFLGSPPPFLVEGNRHSPPNITVLPQFFGNALFRQVRANPLRFRCITAAELNECLVLALATVFRELSHNGSASRWQSIATVSVNKQDMVERAAPDGWRRLVQAYRFLGRSLDKATAEDVHRYQRHLGSFAGTCGCWPGPPADVEKSTS